MLAATPRPQSDQHGVSSDWMPPARHRVQAPLEVNQRPGLMGFEPFCMGDFLQCGEAMNHTPGPWVAMFGEEERGCEVVNQAGDNVCNCGPNDGALIAAAPDLLAALQDALMTAKFEKHAPRPWHTKARAALKKAEGL